MKKGRIMHTSSYVNAYLYTQTGRGLINETTRVVILLRELLNYIDDSLVQIGLTFFSADEEAPRDRASLELAKCLGNMNRLRTLKQRCRDLKKLLNGK